MSQVGVVGIDSAKKTHQLTCTTGGVLNVAFGANDGVDIGNVDIASQELGNTANSLGKQLGEACGADDRGVLMVGKRQDTAANTGDSDGDYACMSFTNGNLLRTTDGALADAINNSKVDVNISSGGFGGAVTNAGTFAVQDGANKAEDSARSDGDVGSFILGVRNDTGSANLPANGDYCHFNLDRHGSLRTSRTDGKRVNLQTSGGGTIADGATSTGQDIQGYNNIEFVMETSTTSGQVHIEVSPDGTNYFAVAQPAMISNVGGNYYIRASLLEPTGATHARLKNVSGGMLSFGQDKFWLIMS